jgi:peptide/nickel transport system substrate-binding protein
MASMGPEALIGTGAYRLEARNDAQDRESYVANDGYFLGSPFVRRIEMLPADNPLTSLAVGELDGAATAVEGVRNEVLDPFRDNPEFGIISSEAGFGFPLFFNMTRGGALADLRFRRACLHALDRPDMVNRLLTGNGQEGSQGFLPPSHPYYNPEVRSYPFDPTEADRLLDEAGYRRAGAGGARTNPDGSPLRYLLYIPDAIPLALAELAVANLRAVGVEVDLEIIDLLRLFGIKLNGSYDMLITSYPGPSGIGPNGDPEFNKATGYANPEVDRLLEAQLETYDVEERKQLVGQIQQIVAEDLPVAMLYYTTTFFAYRTSVFDQWYYTPGGFGPGLPDVYNKHPYITGRQVGTDVRAADEA